MKRYLNAKSGFQVNPMYLLCYHSANYLEKLSTYFDKIFKTQMMIFTVYEFAQT